MINWISLETTAVCLEEASPSLFSRFFNQSEHLENMGTNSEKKNSHNTFVMLFSTLSSSLICH